MADIASPIVPHLKIEVAIMFSDHTWSEGYYVYVPEAESKPEEVAVQRKLEELREVEGVVNAVVHSMGDGRLFDACGKPMEEAVLDDQDAPF